MKVITVILATAVTGFAAGFVVVNAYKNAQFDHQKAALEADWAEKRAALEAALRAAESRQDTAVPAPEPAVKLVAYKPAPKDVLEKLINLKPAAGARGTRTIRQVIHQLENLVECGPEALPAIREFLARYEDVDYTGFGGEDNGGRPGGFGRGGGPPGARRQVNTDSAFPPSLRLGLVGVLKEIGGPEAEKILAEMLMTTGRGIEVAYVAKTLQSMAPDKYRDQALTAARDLLLNPPAINNPSRLDENSKSYLYEVLTMFGDTAFASVAQSLIIDANGRLDRTALNYLNSTLKEQAMPAIYQAFNDSRLTNMWERAALINMAMDYTGPNAFANAMFQGVVTNSELPSMVRAFAIQSLAGGGRGPFERETPTDPLVLQSRLQLVETLRPSLTDERVVQVLNQTSQRLQDLLSGKPADQLEPVGRGPGARFDRRREGPPPQF